MKKFLRLLVIATVCVNYGSAQLTLPLGGSSTGPTPKKTKPTSKMLNGTVQDKNDQPIAGAVVYLKNMKTLSVKSFFAQPDGTYRFPQLALNTDYEIYAEKDGKKSAVKSVSQFDDRSSPTVNLRIDLSKQPLSTQDTPK
jgi:hypothetical protein